jgi:hypothetical protein
MTNESRAAALDAALVQIEKNFPGRLRRLEPGPPNPARQTVAAIAVLAKVPADKLSSFSSIVFMSLGGAWQSSEFRLRAHERKDDAPVRKAETHIRAACDALRAFTPQQRDVFERSFLAAYSYRGINIDLDYGSADMPHGMGMLESMVAALAAITGKSPTFVSSGGGRPKNTFKDWQFRQFVGLLWQTVRKYGGELTFSCKENRGSGTMVDALTLLRPVLPRLIPPALDQKAKTIDRIKRSLGTEAYESFGFDSSASAHPPFFF